MLQPWLSHLNIRPHWMSSLIISNNHNERMMALSNPNYRVIVLDDEPAKYFELINGEYSLPKGESVLPVLLPPPESVQFFIEGEYEKANECYNEYLFYNPNVNHCLNTIFTLLFNNLSVLIFIPQEADQIWSMVNTFINYVYSRYGIIISSVQQPLPCLDVQTITPDMYSTLIDLMYTYGTIPISEFCLQYPLEMVNVVSELAMQKICAEERIDASDFATMPNLVYNFIMGMKSNIIRNISNPEQSKLNIVVNMGG